MLKDGKIKDRYVMMSVATKATIWAFAASVIQKGISVLATPLFTRLLSTSEYAQFTLYQSWHEIIIIFVSLNVFNYATYTGLTKFENDKSNFIASAQSIVTFLSIICFIVYLAIHCIIGDILNFSLPIIVLMFVDMMFFASFSLWASRERMEFRYRVVTLLSIIIGICGPAFSVFLIHIMTADKGFGRIYGTAAINIAIGLLCYIYNYSKSNCILKKKYVIFIFAYCIPLIPHFLSTQILTRFDRIMINDICGASEAGIYSLAYSLSSLLLIVNESIFKSLTPLTYQAINAEDGLDKLKKNVNGITLLIAISNLILILFAPEAVRIFAPEEYLKAIYIIPSVSASVFLTYLFNLFANIEYYYSETKFVTFASILAALSNVLLNYFFIYKYGFVAAGYTTLISYIFYALGHYIFMRIVLKKHNISKSYYDDRVIGGITFVFVVISLLIIPLYNYLVIRYVIILLLSFLMLLKRNTIVSYIKK